MWQHQPHLKLCVSGLRLIDSAWIFSEDENQLQIEPSHCLCDDSMYQGNDICAAISLVLPIVSTELVN